MKIFIVNDTVNWYPSNAIETFSKTTRLDVEFEDYDECDIVWIFAWWDFYKKGRYLKHMAPRIPLKKLKNKKVITTIHHLVPQKKEYWFKTIVRLNKTTDYFHVPCEKTFKQLTPYANKPIKILPYWIDLEIFLPLDRQVVRKNYGIPSDKTIIGSFQRDTESDFKSPKLEKGPDILAEILSKLNEDIFVVLSGPRRDYIINKLENIGVPHKYFGDLKFDEMNNMYNILDWYFITSRFEGGPQAVFESSATKTKVLSFNVGLVSEVLHPNCICSNIEEFVQKFNSGVDERDFNYKSVKNYDKNIVIPKYDAFFTS